MPATVETTGRLDATTFFARFAFTQDALLKAGQTGLQGAQPSGFPAKPPEFETYVHELTHYLQYVTTPYGLFLHLCRLLQNRATIDLVNAVLASGQQIILPLSLRLPALSGESAQRATAAFRAWFNIENLVATLNGDYERRMALMELEVEAFKDVRADRDAQRYYELWDLWITFTWVQERLVEFIRRFNEIGSKNVPNAPMFPDGIDESAIEAETNIFSTSEDRKVDMLDLGKSILGVPALPWDVNSIIESAAKAAEFFESDVTYERLTRWLVTPVSLERAAYRNCLKTALQSIRTQEITPFLLSYMTICELALFGPLLPHHAVLRRRHGCKLRELLPMHRFLDLLETARRVQPMQSREDHRRYVGELLVGLKWVHLDEIVRTSLDGPAQVRNPIAFLYQAAQRWRGVDPVGFIGIDFLLSSSTPEAKAWRSFFNFVIIDYADRTTYHENKYLLHSMTTRSLETLGLQTVMRSDSLVMRAPYGRSADEKAWMTNYLRGRFATLFPGCDFSALRFI